MKFQKGYKMPEEIKRKIYTPERNLKISNSLRGKHFSEEHRLKNRLSHLGKKRSEESKRKQSETLKGHKTSEETKKKISEAQIGKIIPLESIARMKLAHAGKVSSAKGIHWKEESRKKLSETKKRMYKEGKVKFNINSLRRQTPSSLELKMIEIISKLNLPYKFVGDGKFFIEKKCPDFINVNGEKIAIEVYYRKHKIDLGQAKGIGLDGWKKERSELFAKYGWKIIYFDETQVKKEYVRSIFYG